MRSALVTGGTGFIGRHLVRRLIGEGWAVHLLARPRRQERCPGEQASGVAIHPFEGTAESVDAAVLSAEPEVVFHVASRVVVNHRPEDVKDLVESNVLLGAMLADSLARRGPIAFVNVGTTWQFRNGPAYDPACLYAATKQAFVDLLSYWTSNRQLKVISLLLYDTYGEVDGRGKIVELLLRAASGQALDLSQGEQRLHLVHVDDVVEGLIIAGERARAAEPGSNEVYVLDSEGARTLRDVASVVETMLGRRLPLRWGKRPYRDREVMQPYSSGKRLPGWRPSIPLEEGLERCVRSLREG